MNWTLTTEGTSDEIATAFDAAVEELARTDAPSEQRLIVMDISEQAQKAASYAGRVRVAARVVFNRFGFVEQVVTIRRS